MIGEGVNFITFTKRSIKCTFFGCQLKAAFIKLKILVLIFKQGFIIDCSFSLVKAYNISLTFQYKNLYDLWYRQQHSKLKPTKQLQSFTARIFKIYAKKHSKHLSWCKPTKHCQRFTNKNIIDTADSIQNIQLKYKTSLKI